MDEDEAHVEGDRCDNRQDKRRIYLGGSCMIWPAQSEYVPPILICMLLRISKRSVLRNEYSLLPKSFVDAPATESIPGFIPISSGFKNASRFSQSITERPGQAEELRICFPFQPQREPRDKVPRAVE